MNQQYFKANQSLWDAYTPTHLTSDFYDVEGFKAGKTSLKKTELEDLGPVTGKNLLHLQCHFGMDTLSWAREGATVCGVDFSEKAIRAAKELSHELSIPADFICCNVYDVSQHLREQYDIVFTSYGVITWLPDLKQWAQIISDYLRPGGVFYMVEFHPFIWMYDDAFQQITHSYFQQEVIHTPQEGSYAAGDSNVQGDEYNWNHGLGEVQMALIGNGLSVQEIKEYPFSSYNCFPNMEQLGEDQWVFKGIGDKIPYMFSIKAIKPLSPAL